MSDSKIHREILRSSSIIGGAALLNIVVGLIRTKVLAVLLGPAGIGIVGLFTTLMATVSSVAAMGFGTIGTRQIAEATGRDDPRAVVVVRRALFWGTLILAVVGGLLLWLFRGVVAKHVLGDQSLTNEVGWISVGVALTVAAGSQGALLNGLRRIGDMARLSVLSGLLSTLLGLGALWLWGRSGLTAFVLSAPLASFLLGHFIISRMPKLRTPFTPLPVLMVQWRTLLRLGAAFMVTGLIWNFGHLMVRTLVQRELGANALGHFQAAWAISMTYIGFVLQAMGADYYPRLTRSMHDHAAANKMVNDQTEVAVLLAGPVMLGMLGLAPWVIELLYTSQFAAAGSVLRWQILGDILRIVTWPLGYVILASGDGRTYLFMESFSVSVFVAIIWLGLPIFGIDVTGIAFLAMYLTSLPVAYFLAKWKIGLRWSPRIFWMTGLLFVVGALISWVATFNELVGAVVGLIASMSFGLFALARLSHMANLSGPLARLASRYRRCAEMLGGRRD